MRLVGKFSVILLVTIGVQWALARAAGPLDDAAFTVRVLALHFSGRLDVDDDELIESAARLLHRQQWRHWREFNRSAPAQESLRSLERHALAVADEGLAASSDDDDLVEAP